MTTYLVTYDLSAPGQNYDDLIKHLKSYGTWAHALKSTWLIVTDKTSVEVRDAARQFMDSNDKILVVRATVDGAWYGLPKSVSEWLQQHL